MALVLHSPTRILAVAVLVTALTMTSIATAQDTTKLIGAVISGNCRRRYNICESESSVSLSTDNTSVLPGYAEGDIVVLNEEYNISCTVSNDNVTDNLFSCRPSFASNIPAGEYEISLPLENGTRLRAGYILYRPRYFYGDQQVWRAPGKQPSTMFIAGGYSSDNPADGERWSIYGNFDTTARGYTVIIYDTEDKANESDLFGTPTCDNVTLTQNNLTCTVHAKAGMEGQYRFLVQDIATGGYLRGSTVQKLLTIIPPLPAVTSVSGECASQSARCTTGATLTFAGANFNLRAVNDNTITIGDTQEDSNSIACKVTTLANNSLACSLRVDSSVAPGAYPIYAQVAVAGDGRLSPKAPAGYLVVHGKESDKGWITATESLSLFAVDSVAPSVVRDGDTVTITGNFSASQQYNIEFSQTTAPYIADASYNAMCSIATVTASSITCTFTTNELTKSSRYLLVYNVNYTYYLAMNRTKQSPVALYPKTPQINKASGDCATSSDACRNGATLTLIGDGFNPSDTAANRVSLVGLEEASCNVVAVSKDSITCQLTMRSDVTGVYQLQVQTRVMDNEWSTPTAAGSVVLNGGAGVPGWSIGAVPLSPMKGGTTNNIAAIACSIVFGVLFLIVVIALIVICCRYSFVRRGKQNAQEPIWNTTDVSHGNRHETPSTAKGDSQH